MKDHKYHERAKRDELIIMLIKQGYSFTAVARMFNLDVSTIKRIYDSVITPLESGFGELVPCPVTGDTYVHINGDPVRVDGKDNYEAWEGHGDAYIIKFWSENGYAWDLRFGEHKGQVFMKVINVTEDSHETTL